MKRTFIYLLFIVALAACNKKSPQQLSPSQSPVDFQTVVASDRIYRVVVDIDGNVWHWASSIHHQDPRNEIVFTNKNLPTKPQKIETLSNVVSVSLYDGTAIAVTGDGLCFKWEYSSSYDTFAYNKQPKQVSSVRDVKYAFPRFLGNSGIYIVYNEGTAEYLDSNEKRHPIKLPNNDKVKYMSGFMILSESDMLYSVRENAYDIIELNVNPVAKNCVFVSDYSVFQPDGTQRSLIVELPEPDVWMGGQMKTNIKFWGDNFNYNLRHIRYDGVLLDCLGNPLNNADINNLIYLSGDLYLRADGALFESTGGRYEEKSMGKGGNDVTPRRLFGDKIQRVENIKIYTTNLIENLPSKIKITENINAPRYSSQ